MESNKRILSRGYAQDLLESQKWTNGIVPYIIDKSYSAYSYLIILSGMREIEDSTRTNGKDCIKFVQRTTETTYLRIFNGDGCWSYVGKRFTGAQNLSLKIPTKESPGSCINIDTVIHELLHALGFHHEHQRPDRDNYIKIIWDKIYKNATRQFQVLSNGLDLGFGYDYNSIMHYLPDAFSIDGSPTIVPLQSGLQQNRQLTQKDVAEVRKFYRCEINTSTTKKTSMTPSRTATNPCRSNPCQNGGTCRTDGTGYLCNCTSGCIGSNCAQCIIESTSTISSYADFNNAACEYYKSLNLCNSNSYIGSRPIKEACPVSCNPQTVSPTTSIPPEQDFNKEACEYFRSLDLCGTNTLIGNLTIKQACPITCNCFDDISDSCAMWTNHCSLLNTLQNNPFD
ncbi:Zinc metallo ase nas-4 [Brachionus plicatilis]|uniref:Metalloendopeptidase n=1 Tax=Brachionus plicatilis TaxID=10195 RepID=A0A3M7Q0Y0_BRAPC|nr:Zinc metallo ase nas-4 [Brachionus plicatilis]